MPEATGTQPKRIARSRVATGTPCSAKSNAPARRAALGGPRKTETALMAQALASSLRGDRRVPHRPQRKQRQVTLPPGLAVTTRWGRHARAAANVSAAGTATTATGGGAAGAAWETAAHRTRHADRAAKLAQKPAITRGKGVPVPSATTGTGHRAREAAARRLEGTASWQRAQYQLPTQLKRSCRQWT